MFVSIYIWAEFMPHNLFHKCIRFHLSTLIICTIPNINRNRAVAASKAVFLKFCVLKKPIDFFRCFDVYLRKATSKSTRMPFQKKRRTTLSCKRNIQRLVQVLLSYKSASKLEKLFRQSRQKDQKFVLQFNYFWIIRRCNWIHIMVFLVCSRNNIYTTKYKHAYEIMSQR